MRDAHGLDGGCDRARIDELDVLADSPERDVRAERFRVERDLATGELNSYSLAERQQRRSAGADPQPNHPRPAGRRKAARSVQLNVECGHRGRGSLTGCGHVSEPLVGRSAQERQGDVHELGFDATQRGEIRCAAECRLGDLGGEWERDEDSYPRRLEPRGVRLLSDKERDEHHPEKTTEARERGDADPLAAADPFPCLGDLGDQGTHCDTRLSN